MHHDFLRAGAPLHTAGAPSSPSDSASSPLSSIQEVWQSVELFSHCSCLSSDVTFTSSCCRPLVLTLPEATPRLRVHADDVAHCGVGRLAPLPAAWQHDDSWWPVSRTSVIGWDDGRRSGGPAGVQTATRSTFTRCFLQRRHRMWCHVGVRCK